MISVLAMHPLTNGISLCLYHVWVCCFCEGEKGRGREEGTEREIERKGERKREKKRIVLEQERARKHICFGLT